MMTKVFCEIHFSDSLYHENPKISDTQKIAVMILKLKLHSNGPKDADRTANSVEPDQTAPRSDLGLHCLPRPVCPKTYNHYGISHV